MMDLVRNLQTPGVHALADAQMSTASLLHANAHVGFSRVPGVAAANRSHSICCNRRTQPST